jgi:hypothetical protein
VAAGYERALATASDPRVKQDIEILLKSARDQRVTLELNERLMLPYFDLPQALFNSFHGLLDPRVSKSRHGAAVTRLKRYVGAERSYEPIATLVRTRVDERLGDPSLTGPWPPSAGAAGEGGNRRVRALPEDLTLTAAYLHTYIRLRIFGTEYT